jgi:hypothetical protein
MVDVEKIKKELEKYDTTREKVLRLNDIDKYNYIIYGLNYIDIKINNHRYDIYRAKTRLHGGCIICANRTFGYDEHVVLMKKKCNKIKYYLCCNCYSNKLTLCTTCLRETTKCREIIKRKITFWLCTSKFKKFIIPKDIRRLITNLFFDSINLKN